ncbi:OmpH/Skp family outer membrane protein [Acidisoma sp. 7E03]
MRYVSRSLAAAAVALIFAPGAVLAQSSQGWFVPGQSKASGTHTAPKGRAAAASGPTVKVPDLGPPLPATPKPNPDAEKAAEAQANAPIPKLPDLMKEAPPPAPVIGVIGVPDVLQASTAAQGVQKEIDKRRAELTDEVKKEQDLWRQVQSALANPNAHLSQDELRKRELALQQRIASSQLAFRNHEARIQAAAQVALGQIERTLIAVIRQVANSRGMNLVLHRAQVALNQNGFDITDEVTKQLNQVLPSVTVPPDDAFAKVTAASLQDQQQGAQPPLGQ